MDAKYANLYVIVILFILIAVMSAMDYSDGDNQITEDNQAILANCRGGADTFDHGDDCACLQAINETLQYNSERLTAIKEELVSLQEPSVEQLLNFSQQSKQYNLLLDEILLTELGRQKLLKLWNYHYDNFYPEEDKASKGIYHKL